MWQASRPRSSSAPLSTPRACPWSLRARGAPRQDGSSARRRDGPFSPGSVMNETASGNPILVEVTRGLLVESRHAGAIAIADTQGHLLLALGDSGRPVFPRSAVKALQAIPLIESGAADAYGLSDDELAVACASHSGDLVHL